MGLVDYKCSSIEVGQFLLVRLVNPLLILKSCSARLQDNTWRRVSANWYLTRAGEKDVLCTGVGGLEFAVHLSDEYFAHRSIVRTVLD